MVRNLSFDRDAEILCRLSRETEWYMRGVEGHVPGIHPVHHESHQGWTARTAAAAQFHVQGHPAPPAPAPTPPAPAPPATGTPWEHVGPWNIFDDKDNKGEAGTLAAAASPKANPNIIYTGGHNNGVSSGVLKSVDGGVHWTRNSTGIWDTHIWGVFIHPSDPQGNHVLVGTGSGIFESKDGAASWQFVNETEGFGAVVSFAEVTIGGKQYIAANHGNFISSVPVSGGLWQTAKAPGGTGIAQPRRLSPPLESLKS